MSCFFPFSRWISSGSYHVPTATYTRFARRSDGPPVKEARNQVGLTLEAVLKQLPEDGTRVGNQLRGDVQRLLSGKNERHWPSLAQAKEWLYQARYDSRTNLKALGRLPTAVARLQREWKALDLPPQLSLRKEIDRLAVLIDTTVTRSKSSSKFYEMAQIDARLSSLHAEMLALNARRTELTNGRTCVADKLATMETHHGLTNDQRSRLKEALTVERGRLDELSATLRSH